MWKIRILRETNFERLMSSKNAVFAMFGALNFVHLGKFQPSKVQKFMKNQNSGLLNVLKWPFLDLWNL